MAAASVWPTGCWPGRERQPRQSGPARPCVWMHCGGMHSGQGHRASRGSRWALCAACVVGGSANVAPSCRSAGGCRRQNGSYWARGSRVHTGLFLASASRLDARGLDLSLVQGLGGSLHPVGSASVFLSVLVPVFSSDSSALSLRPAGGTGLFTRSQTSPERAVPVCSWPGCPLDAFCRQSPSREDGLR